MVALVLRVKSESQVLHQNNEHLTKQTANRFISSAILALEVLKSPNLCSEL